MTTELFATEATPTTPVTTTPMLAGATTKLTALCAALAGRTFTDAKGIKHTVDANTNFMHLWSLAAQTLNVPRKSLSGYKGHELYNSIISGKPVLDVNALAARNQTTAIVRKADAERIEHTKVAQLGLFDQGIGALIVKQTESQIHSAFDAKGLNRFTPAHMDALDQLVHMKIVS